MGKKRGYNSVAWQRDIATQRPTKVLVPQFGSTQPHILNHWAKHADINIVLEMSFDLLDGSTETIRYHVREYDIATNTFYMVLLDKHM